MKKLLIMSIIILGIANTAYAYTITSTGGYFNENGFLGIPCNSIPNIENSNYWVSGIGTSTYPLQMEITESHINNYGPIDSQTFCQNTTNAQTFSKTVLTDAETPAGTYYYITGYYTTISPTDIDYYYLRFDWNGSDITDFEFMPLETEFIYLDPAYGETVQDTAENIFYADLYYKEDDWIDGAYIRLSYVRQQDLQSAVTNQSLLWTTLDLTDTITSGYNFVSTTTGDLGFYGVYKLRAELRKPSSWWSTTLSWINPFTNTDPDIITSTTTSFIYGQMTSFDSYVASTTESFSDFYASSTLSTNNVKEYCSLSTKFSMTECINALFLPNKWQIKDGIDQLKYEVLNSFPMGYMSEFYTMMSTSTVGSLTIIDATLPNALGLGNANIHLDLTGVLDPILNATTTIFSGSNPNTDSSETLYEITSGYWKILVYVATFIYMLIRILGYGFIPEFGNQTTESNIESVNQKGEYKRTYTNIRSKFKRFK